MMAAWKAAPALAAGNSLVIKPAELTSLSAIRLAELACEAGLPDGVLNVVPGLGETAGQALGRHPDVDVVTFTGLDRGRPAVPALLGGEQPQAGRPRMRRQEPAGRDGRRRRTSTWSPSNVVTAGYANMGENCTCGSRLIVHRSCATSCSSARRGHRRLDRGRPAGPATPDRPDDRASRTWTRSSATSRPAARRVPRVVAGGERALPDSGGYFVEPTVFDGVDNSMTIAREEIFGPVISTIPFDTEDEAIALANDTNYGLAAAVWTNDIDTAQRMASAHVACRDRVGQLLLRGRHHDAVRRLQGVRLRRPRQGPGGVRPVHREEDHLDRGALIGDGLDFCAACDGTTSPAPSTVRLLWA